MVSPRQKLADSIGKVTAQPANETEQDEAWASLRTSINVARKDEAALDAHGKNEMCVVLDFLMKRWTKRKASRGQVAECLRILLARLPWVEAARGCNEELRASLKEALVGSPELLEQLDPQPATEGDPTREQDMAKPEDKLSAIKQRLDQGCTVMKGFDWRFPHDPLGLKLDQATEGFQSLFEGVTTLSTTIGKSITNEDLPVLFESMEQDWNNLLEFLLSMYKSGVRTTYTSRIKFVVVNLRSLSESFRRVRPWAELPWGSSDPMPPIEEAEAKEEARKKREQEDHHYACELQKEEEARQQEREEARNRLLEQDRAMAIDLQKTVERSDPDTSRPRAKAAAGRRSF